MLKKAYIEITNRCNLRCSFCPGTKRVPRTMPPAEFDLVLERLTGQVEYVYLHVMGEPLSHPQLAELLALAAARERKVCITTNGTLLQKRSDELLAAESLHKISVSLHSFEGNDGADGGQQHQHRQPAAPGQKGISPHAGACALGYESRTPDKGTEHQHKRMFGLCLHPMPSTLSPP